MRIAARHYSDAGHLAEIERQLAQLPGAVDLHFARACCLEDLGSNEASAQAYAALLQREPQHLGALTNLGLMLRDRGDLNGAHTLLAQAVADHPGATIALVNLGKTLAEMGDSAGAVAHYRSALALDPDFFAAHHGLALLFEELGDPIGAERHLEKAFAQRASWVLPYEGAAPPLRVLLLVSGRGGDIVAHPFLDSRVVETTMFVPDGFRNGMLLPLHDVVFNSIGDADRCRPSLERARTLLAASAAAVINDPNRVLATGRAQTAARLGNIAGVVVPRTERLERAAISAAALARSGWTYPLLLRSPGFHAGRHFELVAGPAELPGALARVPGTPLFLIAFADTRDADGFMRKYRVLFIDRTIYPVHLAISNDWKVHYFSSDMADRADHRDEERRFLDDPAAALGRTAFEALETIARVLDLDYAGADVGIDAAGNAVIFEANATMAVYPPPAGEQWGYRQCAYDAVIAAVRDLIARRAARISQ